MSLEAKEQILYQVKQILKSKDREEERKRYEELASSLVEAIKEIKVSVPDIVLPDIKAPALPDINIPPVDTKGIERAIERIKFPEFPAIPQPQVIVKPAPLPEIKVEPAKVEFPKEMEVKGIKGFFSSILEAIGGVFQVSIVPQSSPMPVILMDESGKTYRLLDKIERLAITAGGGGPRIIKVDGGEAPAVQNVAMTSADTEYSYTFPAGVKKFNVKLRAQNALLKVAWISGKSGSVYVTIPYGSSYSRDGVNMKSGTTLYFQSATAAQTCEIEFWL